jgi:hypothetical protein
VLPAGIAVFLIVIAFCGFLFYHQNIVFTQPQKPRMPPA